MTFERGRLAASSRAADKAANERKSLLKKPLSLAIAALLLLVVGLWAATSVTFNWDKGSPGAEPEAIKGNAARGMPIAEAERRGPSTINYSLLDQRLQQLVQRPNMVGLAVAVIENGEIRFVKGYGVTDATGTEPVHPDTIFRWASLSKGVAGNMVAKLAEDGELSIYEPIVKYAPSLRLPGGAENRTTIADVLSHRMGLYSHAYDSKLEDGADPRTLRRSLAGLNAICSPGQCHAYQNVAYDAASEVVEKVTGKPYRQVVQERMFLPLGMTSATMTREGLVGAESWAKPHRGGKNSKPIEVTEPYYRVPAAGGVNSSIKDLALWLQAQMGEEPRVLSPEVLTAVQSPRASTPGQQGRMRKFRERVSKTSYGLGWRIYDYAGNKVVAHRGGVAGYRSLLMFDPEKKSGVVALWNSGAAQPGGLEFEVMDMVYELPFKDWLGLNDPGMEPTPEPQEMLIEDEGEPKSEDDRTPASPRR